jgi:hypothetical protein
MTMYVADERALKTHTHGKSVTRASSASGKDIPVE